MNLNQWLSLAICLIGVITFSIFVKVILRVEDYVSKWGLIAIKFFMIALLIMSIGQFYQCIINNTATFVWLKAALCFFIGAGFACLKAITTLKENDSK